MYKPGSARCVAVWK